MRADWLATEHNHLDVSLRRFVGNPAYDTGQVRTDLARFTFLLGDDGESLFGLGDQRD